MPRANQAFRRARRALRIIRNGIATGLVFLYGAGCSKSDSSGPRDAGEAQHPQPEDARATDEKALEALVLLDVRASKAMREADAAAHAGELEKALDIVSKRARPAIEEGLRTGEAVTTKTRWGQAKREELLGILRDRKAEMPRYEEAVRGNDPEKMLASVEAQAAIERRALRAVGEFGSFRAPSAPSSR
ncbi:hypothetical protein AKJ09_09077 [Labilithrix luteola]|uniref:Uncharacterized protein n=2 Tax=Labilithrix luteola TaxID=1391654 RepID=A0A0K1Q9K2_9BACT|nr:hypothetical protein AKJ09_09077 [Labilithrix luteola]